MWSLILGYLLSAVFEETLNKRLIKLFFFRTLSLLNGCIGWFYQEHLGTIYDEVNHLRVDVGDLTGPKKFLSEYVFRNNILIKILSICKYYYYWIYLPPTLEFGTFLLLFGLYIVIYTKFYSFRFKVVKRVYKYIYPYNYLRIFLLQVKSIKIKNLTLNDKIFFSSLFYLFYYGFLKTYFWLDFFVFIMSFILLVVPFVVLFPVFLTEYLAHKYFSKRLALIIQLLLKKLALCFFFLISCVILIACDLSTSANCNENTFLEIFLKFLFFLTYISLK